MLDVQPGFVYLTKEEVESRPVMPLQPALHQLLVLLCQIHIIWLDTQTTPKQIPSGMHPCTHVACNSKVCLDPINLLALLLSVAHSHLTQPLKVCSIYEACRDVESVAYYCGIWLSMSKHHSPCSDDQNKPTWQGYTSANPGICCNLESSLPNIQQQCNYCCSRS